MDADADLDAQIEAQVGEWSSNSNDCFYITLVRSSAGEEHARFQPEHTYPIFGDQEAIFGYRGLNIELTFAAHNLEPRLHIAYDKAFKEQGEIKPTDIQTALAPFLPAEAFAPTRVSFQNVQSYVPPGEKIRSYTRDGEQFEIRCASLADPDARRMLERMQVLVPMFIEGGTALQLEQDWTTQRWKLFTIWSTQPSYALVGYGTSYRVFTLPDRKRIEQNGVTSLSLSTNGEPDFLDNIAGSAVQSPLDLPSRERLSQFLILPTFQGLGHGHELYRAMYKHLIAPSNVQEYTVEDPNESFDDLRDFCDLTFLRGQVSAFAALEINPNISADLLASSHKVPTDEIISKETRDKIQHDQKMEKRQFDRLVEMHALAKIPPVHRSRSRITRREKSSENDRKYFFWRMYIKQRLLVFNRDALIQLDREERIDKLEALVDSNQEHYLKVLERVIQKEKEGIDFDGDLVTNGGGLVKVGKKRKVLNDDDDDDDEEQDEEMETASNASKRPKNT